jgi:transcriptional regulator GlxA family with amidase domain
MAFRFPGDDGIDRIGFEGGAMKRVCRTRFLASPSRPPATLRPVHRGIVLVVLLLALVAFRARAEEAASGVLKAGFVCTPGVFNTELVAPYDVLQHSVYRDSLNYIECFVVTETGAGFESAEGIRIGAHYSFENAPAMDIVVIPSSVNSMDSDLENELFMQWLARVVERATWVITLCDGAFPLAATGALDGRVATTFPGDRERFEKMFHRIDVRYDVNFVVDGKFITSVGGAPSYEPAFYLVERLYGKAHADRSAQGLVVDWDLDSIPHLVVER